MIKEAQLDFIHDLQFQAYYIPRTILLFIIVSFAYLFAKDNYGKIRTRIISIMKQPYLVVFLFYLSFLLVSTLLGRWPKNPFARILNNFGLFTDESINSEFVENVLLFIPYSFFFLQAFSFQKPWKAVFALSLITTCFIEVSQLLLWLGDFQISDIIHNMLGGLAGGVIWYLKKIVVNIIEKKKKVFDKEM